MFSAGVQNCSLQTVQSAQSILIASNIKPRIPAAVGKRVNGNLYFHVTALEGLDPHICEQARQAALQAGLEPGVEFNVTKIDEQRQQMSLLYYENCFANPLLALQRSCVVDFRSSRVKYICCDLSNNPPILHRKELLVFPDHPQVLLLAGPSTIGRV